MVPNYSANDSHSTPPIKSTAVAIDKDKNSPYAVRWAIDHLMVISNPFITLIHVRPKTNHINNRRYPLSLFHYYYLAYILPCRYYRTYMSICTFHFDFGFCFLRVYAEGANDANHSAESENDNLFIPYRGYCARKGVRTYVVAFI